MSFINYQLDNIDDTEFKPYDRYGRYDIIPGLYWKQLHYDNTTQCGTYLLKFNKAVKTILHEHSVYEEFLIIDGSLYDSLVCKDSDNKCLEKGTYIKMNPHTKHYSYSPNGCLVFVISHGNNLFSKL